MICQYGVHHRNAHVENQRRHLTREYSMPKCWTPYTVHALSWCHQRRAIEAWTPSPMSPAKVRSALPGPGMGRGGACINGLGPRVMRGTMAKQSDIHSAFFPFQVINPKCGRNKCQGIYGKPRRVQCLTTDHM